MKSIWIVTIEANIDGNISFYSQPCANKSEERNEMYDIEEREGYYFINDPSDDYYLDVKMENHKIVQ